LGGATAAAGGERTSGVLPFYLASASPRRRELLEMLGVAHRLRPVTLDERALPGEPAGDHVVRLAAAKAAAAAHALRAEGIEALALGADTTVSLDGAILGKPGDAAEALAMLRRLAGKTHEVLTACRVVRGDDGRAAAGVAVTRVRFAPWDEARARWYVATGEPMDKAGAYGIQGRGVLLSEAIEGSWSNVVGLPLELLPRLFREVGDDLFTRMERSRTG
jgi:septum formation protein